MSKVNNANSPLRWTLQKAADEFEIDRRALQKNMAQASIEAGKDGKYSTAQMTAAKFGDMHGEKLGKLKAERIAAEIKAAEALGAVVLTADAKATLADYGTKVRSAIQSAAYISAEAKARLLESLRAIADGDAPKP